MPEKKVSVLSSDWLTTEETMQALGKSRRTIQKLAQAKHLRFRMQPNRGTQRPERMYNLEDVERLRQQAPQPPERASVPAPKQPPPPKEPSLEAKAFLLLCTELREQRKLEAETQERERAAAFLTLREAASYLRMPRSYVLREIEEGRLAAVKAAGWRIQYAALSAFRAH